MTPRERIAKGESYCYPHCWPEWVTIAGNQYLRYGGESGGFECFDAQKNKVIDLDLAEEIQNADIYECGGCDSCPFLDDCSLDTLDEDDEDDEEE